MKKKTLVIIFGGQSSEYDVSLSSVSSILQNIDREKYEVITLGITREGRWLIYNGPSENIISDQWIKNGNVKDAFISPSSYNKGLIILNNDMSYTKIQVDVIFPVLHGQYGEDGNIQGVLEMSGIPYVGCGTLSSAICMDKGIAHDVLTQAGINTAPWVLLQDDDLKDTDSCINTVERSLNYPVFVKPANAGSSVGISKANNKDDLRTAIEIANKIDSRIVVEQMIHGKEIECAVLGNENPIASCLGEIVPVAEFYDYDAKYKDNSTELYVPARIDKSIEDLVRKTAVKAYKAMCCSGLARVDFFVEDNGNIILNEINTLPGFTPISMYPKLFNHVGKPYPKLIDELINLAIERADI